jgi:hypothetical protein
MSSIKVKIYIFKCQAKIEMSGFMLCLNDNVIPACRESFFKKDAGQASMTDMVKMQYKA